MSHGIGRCETAATADTPTGALKHAIVDFVRRASTEVSTNDENLLEDLARRLPAGMPVYVAHTPKASIEDVVRVAIKVQSLGFVASPHLVARRLPSEQALRQALARLRQHGIEQALLVAGDLDSPIGPFRNSLEVIATGVLEQAGLKRIGVAGHPEGHPAVGPAELLSALRYKQEFAVRSGIAVHIATQFGFNAQGICAWDRMLSREGITLPVHVGVAGPAPLTKLLKFAIHCGIGASVSSLMKNKGTVAGLSGFAASPGQMLLGLVQGGAAYRGSRLALPHVYSFGGILATADWLRAMMGGAFELAPDGTKLTVHSRPAGRPIEH